VTRREALAGIAMGVPAVALGAQAQKNKGFRVCFFTDAHLPGENTLDRLPDSVFHHQARVRRAFDKANSFSPQLYVFGGDNIFAIDQGNTEANAEAQFRNWRSVVKQKVKVPHFSALGNHDIWRPEGVTPPDRKALARAAYEMPDNYFVKDYGGWRFIVVDPFTWPKLELGQEQMVWMEAKMRSFSGPVCVVCHLPMLSVSAQLIGGAVGDIKGVRELFYRNENVRLVLTGHQHQVDRCEFDRVTYLCGGAVSGSWWEGDYQHFAPAFVNLQLRPDGSFDDEVVFWETPKFVPPPTKGS
jgi:3',5'-cyclic AMP phosphodiesterase CpdA